MIIKLLSTQIPRYWEVIKYGATIADEVDEKNLQPYLVELLHALLSDKAQCWMRLDENRKIVALLITRITIDKITGNKSLYLQCLFSHKKVSDNIWKDNFDLLIRFVKQEKCKNIIFESRHSRIWEIATSLGFKEMHRSFVYDLE